MGYFQKKWELTSPSRKHHSPLGLSVYMKLKPNNPIARGTIKGIIHLPGATIDPVSVSLQEDSTVENY